MWMESAGIEGKVVKTGEEEEEEGGIVLASRLDVVHALVVVGHEGTSGHVCGGR